MNISFLLFRELSSQTMKLQGLTPMVFMGALYASCFVHLALTGEELPLDEKIIILSFTALNAVALNTFSPPNVIVLLLIVFFVAAPIAATIDGLCDGMRRTATKNFNLATTGKPEIARALPALISLQLVTHD